jgi:hypothetical protein
MKVVSRIVRSARLIQRHLAVGQNITNSNEHVTRQALARG